MTRDELYMQRCFDLALSGAGHTSPNPMVGAVLVYEDRIIGEGFHARYGAPHAEVNAVASVPAPLRHLIPKATLYVSLEPCCITGKTGPCTHLILEQGIRRVVVSCLDLSPGVAGRGIAILQSAGVEVTLGVLEKEGRHLSRFRNHFVTRQAPYVILKYAVTPSGRFAPSGNRQAWITGPLSRRFTHRLRSETDAILVGARTAAIDNPQLDNRYYFGPSPLRIVLDRHLALPENLHLFDGAYPTLLVNELKNEKDAKRKLEYLKMDFGEGFLPRLLGELHRRKISTLLVEGGAQVIRSFFDAGLWQETYIYTGSMDFREGIAAPQCPGECVQTFSIGADTVRLYRPVSSE
jgi:diaminohydroxyphosphoribosylaminopyrimidine deaminase / 5-amino-6-(5-phosphoribosylamino)uracil reductase